MCGSIPARETTLLHSPRGFNAPPGLSCASDLQGLLDKLETLCGNAGTETGSQKRVEEIVALAGVPCCRALAACSPVQRAGNSWKNSGQKYRCVCNQ